jgi:hypothetical protein
MVRGRRWWVPVGAAFTALVLGGCSGSTSSGLPQGPASATGSSPGGSVTAPSTVSSRASADPLPKTFAGAGITFRYLNAWHAQTYQEVSSFSNLIAYVSTEPLHDPCVTRTTNTGTEIDCTNPLKALRRNGIFISWDSYGFPGQRLTTPTLTLDGHAATVQSGPADPSCVAIGGTRLVSANVALSLKLAPPGGHDQMLRMRACIAGPDTAQAETDVYAMLASLRIHR